MTGDGSDKEKWTKKKRCKEEEWGKLSEPRREEYSAGSPTVEQSWGIGTAATAWGNGIEVGAPLLLRLPPAFSKEVKERFLWLIQSQAILPVHIVWVELQHHCLSDKSFRIARYSRKVPGVLEFYEMVMFEPMLSHCQFGCPSHMRTWCSFIMVCIDRPLCPMYTWLHLQGML